MPAGTSPDTSGGPPGLRTPDSQPGRRPLPRGRTDTLPGAGEGLGGGGASHPWGRRGGSAWSHHPMEAGTAHPPGRNALSDAADGPPTARGASGRLVLAAPALRGVRLGVAPVFQGGRRRGGVAEAGPQLRRDWSTSSAAPLAEAVRRRNAAAFLTRWPNGYRRPCRPPRNAHVIW